jgi:hypothetical protein
MPLEADQQHRSENLRKNLNAQSQDARRSGASEIEADNIAGASGQVSFGEVAGSVAGRARLR